MRGLFLSVLLLLIALKSVNASASEGVFQVPDGEVEESLLPYTEFLTSADHPLTPEDVLKEDANWQPLSEKPMGYHDEWFWFKTRLKNHATAPRSLFFLFKNPFVWHFDFFVVRKDANEPERLEAKRGVGEPRFEIPIAAGEAVTILIRTKFPYHSRVSLRLFDDQSILTFDLVEHFFVFACLGMLFGLLIYNLILYVTLHEVSHLHYFLCALASLCVIALQSGYAQMFLEGPWVWLNNAVSLLTCISIIVFTKTFLTLEKLAPRLSRFMNVIIVFAILHMAIVGLRPVAFFMYGFEVIVLMTAGSCVAGGIFSLKNKFLPAKYFLYAWAGMGCVGSYWIASNFGFTTSTFYASYTLTLGLVLMMHLLSLALASRINMLRVQLIEALKNQNEELGKRVAAEAEIIKRQQLSLVHSAKMSALGQMASGVAHEINNPLTIIRGRVSLIRYSMENGPIQLDRFSQDLSIIDATSVRIAKITKSLLAFAKGEEDDPFTRSDLKMIVEDILLYHAEKFKMADIKITLQADGHTDVYCRSQQIAHVVLGLLNNSYDAVVDLKDRWVRIEVVGSDKEVKLRVVDSGPGIPTELVDRIMEPFFTTKGIGKGVGLGLSVSKGVLEEQGGRLFVDKNARNTCIGFTLPRRDIG